MNHYDAMQQSLDDEHEFYTEYLNFFPADLTPAEMLGHAIDILVSDCPKIKHNIWKTPHVTINDELLQNESLNRSERLMIEAALSLWTPGEGQAINLWDFLHKTEFKGNQNFIRALTVLFHWYASRDRHVRPRREDTLKRKTQAEKEMRRYMHYQ